MKVIICGDRECEDMAILEQAIKDSGFKITKVIYGDARGADTLGKEWAENNGIPFKTYKPKWDDIKAEGAVVKEKINNWTKKKEKYNAMAGFKRNSDMVDDADAVIALQPNGPTEGISDTIKKAKKKGIPVYIYEKQKSDYKFEF